MSSASESPNSIRVLISLPSQPPGKRARLGQDRWLLSTAKIEEWDLIFSFTFPFNPSSRDEHNLLTHVELQTSRKLHHETKRKEFLFVNAILLSLGTVLLFPRSGCLSRRELSDELHLLCVWPLRFLLALLLDLLSVSSVQFIDMYSWIDLGHTQSTRWLSHLGLELIVLLYIWTLSPTARSSLGSPGKTIPGSQDFR